MLEHKRKPRIQCFPSMRIVICRHYWAIVLTVLCMKPYRNDSFSVLNVDNEMQFIRTPQNQTVAIGDRVQLECVPRAKVKYVIWYFQPHFQPEHFSQLQKVSSGSEPESLELAVCQPNVLCKDKHALSGLTIQPNGRLLIYPVTLDHVGKYECAVVAGVHAFKVQAHIIVETGPSIPTINLLSSISSRTSELHEGDLVRLICTCTRGYPIPRLMWLKKDLTSVENASVGMLGIDSDISKPLIYTPSSLSAGIVQLGLLLNLSWDDHDTEILCKAINRVGTQLSKPYRFRLTFSPRIRPFRYNPWIVLRDESVPLYCDAVASPEPAIQWIGPDGTQLSSSVYLNSDVLVKFISVNYAPAKPIWSMNLTCVAINRHGMAQRSLIVEVQSPPIVVTNRFVYARIGQSIRLHCEAVSNPPVIRVFWDRQITKSMDSLDAHVTNKSETTMPDEKRQSRYDSQYWFSPTLQINSITKDDAGTYRCVAENIVHGSGRSPVQKQSEDFSTIYVYYPPGQPLVRANFPSKLTIGAAIKLECYPNADNPGLPAPTLRWKWRPRSCNANEAYQYRSPDETVWNSSDSEANTLVIPSVQSRDDGFYVCEAKNGIGEALSITISVEVNIPVQIVEKPTAMQTKQTKGTLLATPQAFRCVARGRPYPKVSWKHNGRLLKNHSDEPAHAKLSAFHVQLHSVEKCVQLSAQDFTWETTSELMWMSNVSIPINNDFASNSDLGSSAEGIYTCEADNQIGPKASATVRLNFQYAPQRMHSRLVKQVLMKTAEWSMIDSRRSTELLNDPPPLSGFAPTIYGTISDTSIYCIVRANPAPIRITWFLISDGSSCTSMINRTTCDCSDGKELITVDTIQTADSDDREAIYRTHMLRGLDAERFIASVLGRNLAHTSDTTAIIQLIFTRKHTPQLGTYAAKVINSFGCELCMVQLKQLSSPEDVTNLQVDNVTWNAVLLSWQSAFDGGLPQTVVVERSTAVRVESGHTERDQTELKPNLIRLTNVPRLPAAYHCWLFGLEPDTSYRFVLYTENALGRSEHPRTIHIKTPTLEFPQLERLDPFADRIELHFTEAKHFFCVQIEINGIRDTQWHKLYNDCSIFPNGNNFNHSVIQYLSTEPRWMCQVNILSSSNWFWLESVNRTEHFESMDDTPVEGSNNQAATSEVRMKPLTVQRKNLSTENEPNYSQISGVSSVLSGKDFRYRIRTCLPGRKIICSPDTIYTEAHSESKPIELSFVWATTAVVLLMIFGLATCVCVRIRRKRIRTMREQVWVRQPHAKKQSYSRNTADGDRVRVKMKKMVERQSIVTSSFDSAIEDSAKSNELFKSVSNETSIVISEAGYGTNTEPTLTPGFSSAPSSTVITPTESFNIIRSISSASTAGAVTPCSLLLNGAAVGPGTQVLSPIFSMASPSDLIRDVDASRGHKTSNPTSSVLLIPAAQLSTLEFSTKSVEEDPVSLILHIPVQSNLSS